METTNHRNIWVATDSYDDILPPPEVHKAPPKATEPPLLEAYSSPWIGKTIEDCAKWLEKKSRAMSTDERNCLVNTGVSAENFLVMNNSVREEDSVLVCRIMMGDSGEARVEHFPQPTGDVHMQMWTN
jgi:hypothetical protein